MNQRSRTGLTATLIVGRALEKMLLKFRSWRLLQLAHH